MRKNMRKTAIIVAGILLVLGALVVLALFNLDRLVKRNKAYILAQAEQAVGRKISVKDIGVTLWGGIGVRLEEFALADDRAFSSQDFIRASDLQVNVAFLPLLRRQLQIKRLILHDPTISVIRDKKGAFNFATIGGPAQPGGQARTGPTAQPASTGALPLLVSLVDVRNGEVRYLDAQEGTDLRVSQIDLKVEELGFDRPISVRLAAAINADRPNLTFAGKIGPLPSSIAGGNFANLPLNADVTLGPITLASLKRFRPVAQMIPKTLVMEGPVSVSTHAEGTPDALAVTAKVDATSSSLNYGTIFRKAQGIPLVFSADARVTHARIDVKKTGVRLHTLDLGGRGEIVRGATPSARLTVDSSKSDLAGWKNILPALQGYDLAGSVEVHLRVEGPLAAGRLPNIDGALTLTELKAAVPNVPQPLRAKAATVNFTGQRADLPDTLISIGKSQMRVAAQVDRFVPMTLTHRLTAPELWVADLRAGGGAGTKPEVLRDVKSDGRASMDGGSLAYQGKITSARGTIADFDYTNLQATLSMADQVATINSFQLETLGGLMQGRGRYDMRKTPPQFAVTAQARSINVAELFRPGSAAATKHIRGQANLDLNLTGSGDQWPDIQKSLTGQGQADVQKGALLDVNIAEGALTGLTGVPGITQLISPNIRSKYPSIFHTRNSEFGQLKGSLNVREGKVHLDNLLMAAADWAMEGNGWVTLDQQMNLRGRLLLSPQLSADLVAGTKILRVLRNAQGRLEIPFLLSGTLPGVSPKPDLDYVAKLVQRGLVQQGIEELIKPQPPPATPQTQQPQPATPETQQPQPATPEKTPEKKTPEQELLKGLKDLLRR